MASLARILSSVPVPLFGNARTAGMFVASKAKALPRMAGWAVPLGAGALWFVWPAVDDGWKIEVGLMADPEAAAKAAAAAAEAAPQKVELSAEAAAKVEAAYKAGEAVATDDDKMLAKAESTGDYSYFEEKWEAFSEKSGKPGEDDDDDDDDEDDDDDDDEDEDEDDDDE